MALSDLLELRAQLRDQPLPPEPGTIVALRVPVEGHYHLGLTSEGRLCALVETRADRAGVDLRLRNLEVQQGVRCRISAPGTAERSVTGSLVVCRAEAPAMLDLFLRLYAEAIDELGPAPGTADVSGWLQRLSSLLSRLEQDGRRRLQGLWAELLLIRDLGDPDLLIRRWRPDPHERFDFLGSGFALEAKSCQDFERVHEFSLAQLRPPEGLTVWVASLVVRRDPRGASVLDLLQELEMRLSDRSQRHALREITLATGGAALEDDDHHRFDAALASASLRLLATSAIPSLRGDLPPEVLSVKLRVRCDGVADAGSPTDAIQRLRSAGA